MNNQVLAVHDMRIQYQKKQHTVTAVDGISFDINKGQTLGIIGESGAGKSSVGLALMGLLDKRTAEVSGQAQLSGTDLLSLDEKEFASIRGSSISMLFQDPVATLDPTMKVFDQVIEAIRLQGVSDWDEAAKYALQALQAVGIDEETLAIAPYAHQLSGGQCQRIQIASSLAGAPSLLIADEPTSSLDTVTQKLVIDQLNELRNEKGTAMIFISHDLPLVAGLADVIMVMRQGKAVETGAAADLLKSPSHPFTSELIESQLAVAGAAVD